MKTATLYGYEVGIAKTERNMRARIRFLEQELLAGRYKGAKKVRAVNRYYSIVQELNRMLIANGKRPITKKVSRPELLAA